LENFTALFISSCCQLKAVQHLQTFRDRAVFVSHHLSSYPFSPSPLSCILHLVSSLSLSPPKFLFLSFSNISIFFSFSHTFPNCISYFYFFPCLFSLKCPSSYVISLLTSLISLTLTHLIPSYLSPSLFLLLLSLYFSISTSLYLYISPSLCSQFSLMPPPQWILVTN
jgi:hypothetical protein